MPVSIASTCTAEVCITYRHIYVDARQLESVSIVGGSWRHDCDVTVIRYPYEGSQHAEKGICGMYRRWYCALDHEDYEAASGLCCDYWGLCLHVACPRWLGEGGSAQNQERCPGVTRRQRRLDAWARCNPMSLPSRNWLSLLASSMPPALQHTIDIKATGRQR